MAQAKRASKGKRSAKAVSVLGIAGVSLAASTSGSTADVPPQNTAPLQAVNFNQPLTLGEEDISDVSLATFHLFDKDEVGMLPQVQLAARGGCGCGHGCGGGRGCGGGGFRGCGGGGFRGCGGGGFRGCGGCRGCGRGCGWGGCWTGGCTGCCLSWGGCYLC
jgi:hypothetical protein